MADQTRKGKPRKDEEEAQAEEAKTAEAKTSDIDELLDEIDEVLEVNSEEFVRSYVQKGGQAFVPISLMNLNLDDPFVIVLLVAFAVLFIRQLRRS